MQRDCVHATLVIAVYSLICNIGFAATIDFETIPLGTVYGRDVDNFPGQVVLGWEQHDGIDMAVENFFLDSFGFFTAEIVSPKSELFNTQALSLNNITVLFDFSHIGFEVDSVTLEIGDPGGTNNIVVNNEMLHILDPITDLPVDVAFGITANISNGLMTLTGIDSTITTLLIGGQEMIIDNLIAVPEPATSLLLLTGGVMVFRKKRHRLN